MTSSAAAGTRLRPCPPALAPMVLNALGAKTGREIYSSRKLLGSWVHFSQPAVAQGKVFMVSHDAHVCTFGLKR